MVVWYVLVCFTNPISGDQCDYFRSHTRQECEKARRWFARHPQVYHVAGRCRKDDGPQVRKP